MQKTLNQRKKIKPRLLHDQPLSLQIIVDTKPHTVCSVIRIAHSMQAQQSHIRWCCCLVLSCSSLRVYNRIDTNTECTICARNILSYTKRQNSQCLMFAHSLVVAFLNTPFVRFRRRKWIENDVAAFFLASIKLECTKIH